MSEAYIDHDEWNHSPPKSPKAPKIELNSIFGLLPFDGTRNPGFRSSTSHRVFLTYKTAANDWQPEIGICESAAEAAVAYELLISENTYDLGFQPLKIQFDFDGKLRHYTHDFLLTRIDGHRRLIFVRNGESLSKPRTWREIKAIAGATPSGSADDMIVVNADDYSRQRRENLFRMHYLMQERDEAADEIVFHSAKKLKSLWLMQDLFPHVPLEQPRVFRACYRLIARKKLLANLDHVISEVSRVIVAK